MQGRRQGTSNSFEMALCQSAFVAHPCRYSSCEAAPNLKRLAVLHDVVARPGQLVGERFVATAVFVFAFFRS